MQHIRRRYLLVYTSATTIQCIERHVFTRVSNVVVVQISLLIHTANYQQIVGHLVSDNSCDGTRALNLAEQSASETTQSDLCLKRGVVMGYIKGAYTACGKIDWKHIILNRL